MFNGRSMPGFHAGEITRATNWLGGRADVSRVVAVLAADNIHPAVLVSAVAATGGHTTSAAATAVENVAVLGILGGLARYQDLAAKRLYWTPPWTDIPGVLAAFDLYVHFVFVYLPQNVGAIYDQVASLCFLLRPVSALASCAVGLS